IFLTNNGGSMPLYLSVFAENQGIMRAIAGKSRKSFTFMDIPQCHAFGLLIFPVPSSFVVLLHWITEWRSKSVCENGVQCVRTVSARHDAFTVSIRENSRIFHGRAVQPR
ncbi:hypothetical protein AD947_00120, partial [Acetobacter tropicalis]